MRLHSPPAIHIVSEAVQQVYDRIAPVSRGLVARRQIYSDLTIGRITLQIAFEPFAMDFYALYRAMAWRVLRSQAACYHKRETQEAQLHDG
jgi:hypothetical protein